MYNNKLFIQFCRERNIKQGTAKCYCSSIENYISFHDMTIDELIEEAIIDEENNILLKNRRIKKRLLDYRSYLLDSNLSPNTVKTYFSKLKTFYSHFEIELPQLPDAKFEKTYETNYLDLPTREHIAKALEIVPLSFQALLLFMSSSGTAKAETLSLTVDDFIKATYEYHNKYSLNEILDELEQRDDIIPTIYLRRIKTDKYYYTFCSNEASTCIVKYLKTRKNLKASDKLFPFSNSSVITMFQKINDRMNWGYKGNYRFFRSHTLRKYHASNLELAAEYIDALQGRSKNIVHETYIKTNPEKLKEKYKKVMKNVIIYPKQKEKEVKEDIHITINIFLSDTSYNIY
ncbi:phage integrase N-terminal SAM-like domain-containing protein [Methanosphaera sp. WGK6]|uniref:phage integrase N-terminal SAM-like domain-containing protein n=1 Tax=Methanosphaera sp. WGK6 TaxID=1561964 RepID=UPI00084C5D11|nr:phage integrase N-terminal SAM-like domain-containing protein [Methanosphaera sp. WGK6]